jgi:O-antigen/teichoic acid export membrane protein
MSGRPYVELGNTCFVAALNIMLSLALIPRYGITGAAASMLTSQMAVLVIRSLEIHYILRLHLNTAKYIKPLIALIPFLLLVIPFRHSIANLLFALCFRLEALSVATTFLLLVTLYLVIVYLLGLEREDVTVWRELRLRAPAATSGN